MLAPTRPQLLVDQQQRPYFLWDSNTSLAAFRRQLGNDDPDVRAYWIGRLMRQAKPDDVFQFVSAREIRELWPRVARHLGQTRAFWSWLFEAWERQGRAWK